MTSRALLLSAYALSVELAAGIRAASKEGAKATSAANASALQQEMGYTCYDVDGGEVNTQGFGCDLYDHQMCMYPEYKTATFDASKMCCICGGGSARARDGSCPATCHGYTCDEWVTSGYSCSSLEEEYSCNCQGCQLCEKDAPKFKFLGTGDCVLEDESGAAFESYMWTGPQHCALKCEGRSDCTGYAASNLFCHIFTQTGLKAHADPDMGEDAQCWAKASAIGQGSKPGGKPAGSATKQPTVAAEGPSTQLNSAFPVDPTEADPDDDDEDDEGNEASDKEERRVASQSPKALPVIGLKKEDLAQTFKFLKSYAGYGASVFNLDASFYPMDACQDDNPSACWADTRMPGTCEEQPELKKRCKKSCGLCETRNQINVNIMYLVQTSEKSHYDSQRIVFANEQGALTTYSMLRPRMVGTHDTWRVLDAAGEVVFTIQKRKHDADCKYLFFDCKAVWKIYQGRKRDGLLRFYGIQHQHAFKFYPSREDFKKDNVKWLASFKKTLPTAENSHSSFQVTVMPGQDAGLMLLAAYAVNNAGDMVKLKKEKK